MRSDLLGMLERPAVLKIQGQGGISGAPLYHVENIASHHRVAGEFVAL
jgi:hypothetical protein